MSSRIREEKSWLQKFFGSKIVLTSSLILLILISIALGKAVYKRHQIQEEINAIKEEIEALEGKNKEMTQLIEYLNTDAFKEKMARQKLNLKKEGETVISIPVRRKEEETLLGLAENRENVLPSRDSNMPNPQKWWDYFFAAL